MNWAIIICNEVGYHWCFMNVLIENVGKLTNFDIFRPRTFYVSIGSENVVYESCLSHRDEAFDTKLDKFRCFLTIFEFSSTTFATTQTTRARAPGPRFSDSPPSITLFGPISRKIILGLYQVFPSNASLLYRMADMSTSKLDFSSSIRRQNDLSINSLHFCAKKEFQFLTSESSCRRRKMIFHLY